ncbi:response regulator [Caballeronia sp. ATUFL_M2_KS44]|uniref:response regulator n=1 Tax=Caballeronia sp. ATUFL_M2_KS44 TaxID=2921767 RepID=UPI0020296805|nr:response regulator [Caballeronia sp. ATUFL_M2_KS44]
MRTEKIRLVVADGQPVIVAGLQNWFGARGRYCIAASASSTEQLLATLQDTTGDVIVIGGALDANAPAGDDSVELLCVLRQRYPETPVVVLTADTGARALRAMQRAGAAGIASTRDELREFGRICDRVLSGVTGLVSRRIAACLESNDEPPVRQAFSATAKYGDVRVSVKPFSAKS